MIAAPRHDLTLLAAVCIGVDSLDKEPVRQFRTDMALLMFRICFSCELSALHAR